jgi:hypothetical protein
MKMRFRDLAGLFFQKQHSAASKRAGTAIISRVLDSCYPIEELETLRKRGDFPGRA